MSCPLSSVMSTLLQKEETKTSRDICPRSLSKCNKTETEVRSSKSKFNFSQQRKILILLWLEIQTAESSCTVCALHKGPLLRRGIWLKLCSVLSCPSLVPTGTEDCIYQRKGWLFLLKMCPLLSQLCAQRLLFPKRVVFFLIKGAS